jgi:hypothetical protein
MRGGIGRTVEVAQPGLERRRDQAGQVQRAIGKRQRGISKVVPAVGTFGIVSEDRPFALIEVRVPILAMETGTDVANRGGGARRARGSGVATEHRKVGRPCQHGDQNQRQLVEGSAPGEQGRYTHYFRKCI